MKVSWMRLEGGHAVFNMFVMLLLTYQECKFCQHILQHILQDVNIYELFTRSYVTCANNSPAHSVTYAMRQFCSSPSDHNSRV